MSVPEFDIDFWNKLNTSLPGWMSEEEARFLVENVQGGVYLEIGVAFGKSLRVVRHHFPEMEIHGIDLINHGVHEKVDALIEYGNANQLVKNTQGEWLDTIFIDGDHTYKGCLSDFVHWYDKVKPGGKIIFHDYGRPTREHEGVTQAVDAIKPLLVDFKETKYISCGTKN
jgi:hypothetical protein